MRAFTDYPPLDQPRIALPRISRRVLIPMGSLFNGTFEAG
jgi:hypothetical protein